MMLSAISFAIAGLAGANGVRRQQPVQDIASRNIDSSRRARAHAQLDEVIDRAIIEELKRPCSSADWATAKGPAECQKRQDLARGV